MNEKKKLWIMVGVVVGLIIFTVAIYFVGNLETQRVLKDIDQKINSEETQVFYLARPTCHYCILLEPVTETLKQEYQLTYNHINTDKFSTSQLKKILDKFGVNSSTFGTPHITITKNGEVVDQLSGYADENVVFELFQKNGLIPESATLAFQYIDYNTFQTIWNNGERRLIMIGETGEKSVQARNTLKPLIQTYHLDIAYMDIAETGTNYNTFLTSISHTTPTYPILMVVENGTILSETNQTTVDAYETFLRENGYIN